MIEVTSNRALKERIIELELKVCRLKEKLTCYKAKVQKLTKVNQDLTCSLERLKLEESNKTKVVIDHFKMSPKFIQLLGTEY